MVYQLPFKPDEYMKSPDKEKCGNCELVWDKSLVSSIVYLGQIARRHFYTKGQFCMRVNRKKKLTDWG